MTGGRTSVTRLHLRGFRNLRECVVEPAARFNLIHGDNGHGKTSLIEALYVLATTKSFRARRLLETIQEGSEAAGLGARVHAFGLTHDLRAHIGPRGRSFLLDGKRPRRFVDYALKTPVIVFHPGELSLTAGPAASRRTLLDRVMLYVDPSGADARTSYQKALRDRQHLLELGRGGAELEVYERLAAEHGARLTLGRGRTAERVVEGVQRAFAEMTSGALSLRVDYQPGGSDDVEQFAQQLSQRRRKDSSRGAATFGPHRDELELWVAGRPARSHASQGQQRLVSLALKLAELSCVREVTGAEPLLLLDDVSSELDPERTQAVFQFLRASESQIFVTTTRPELFEKVSVSHVHRANFRVRDGVIERTDG